MMSNPRYAEASAPHSSAVKYQIMAGKARVEISIATYSDSPPRNFPTTMAVSLTG